MKPLSRDHIHALTISAAITAVLVVTAAFFIDWPAVREFFPPANQETVPAEDKPDIAVALAYVKTLPAYNPIIEPNLHFDKITQALNHVSLVEFIGLSPTRYLVFWQDGRVIGHEVQTSDETGAVTIINPEPEESLSRTTVPVRGVTKPNQVLAVRLLNAAGNATISTQTVTADDKGAFNLSLDARAAKSGRYMLSVSANDATVTLPIVFDIRR